MATTVDQLIVLLERVKDKTQPVIYQYYLAEHFETTPKKFESAVEDLDCNELWDDAYQTLNDYIN